MADGNHLRPPGCGRRNATKLIRMLDMRLRLRTFGQFDEALSCVPDLESPMPFPHLDHRAGYRWR